MGMDTITTEVIPTERTRDTRGHRLYSEERQRELIAAYRQSGLTQAAFARREGLKYSTFTAWLQGRRGVARPKRPSAVTAEPLRFAQVELPAVLRGGLEVVLPDGACVRGPEPLALAALVRALRR